MPFYPNTLLFYCKSLNPKSQKNSKDYKDTMKTQWDGLQYRQPQMSSTFNGVKVCFSDDIHRRRFLKRTIQPLKTERKHVLYRLQIHCSPERWRREHSWRVTIVELPNQSYVHGIPSRLFSDFCEDRIQWTAVTEESYFGFRDVTKLYHEQDLCINSLICIMGVPCL